MKLGKHKNVRAYGGSVMSGSQNLVDYGLERERGSKSTIGSIGLVQNTDHTDEGRVFSSRWFDVKPIGGDSV